MRHPRCAAGEADMGFNQISEVLAQPTVEFTGGLPSAIQNYTQFAAVIVSGSSQTDVGRALVTFLSSPAAQTVLKATEFARESDSTRDIQKELERILVTVRDGRDDQLKAQFRLAIGLGLGLLSIIAAYF